MNSNRSLEMNCAQLISKKKINQSIKIEIMFINSDRLLIDRKRAIGREKPLPSVTLIEFIFGVVSF